MKDNSHVLKSAVQTSIRNYLICLIRSAKSKDQSTGSTERINTLYFCTRPVFWELKKTDYKKKEKEESHGSRR